MDTDLKQDETDAQIAAKKPQADRDAAEAKRQADNKATAARLSPQNKDSDDAERSWRTGAVSNISGTEPNDRSPRHTRVSVSAAAMQKHFEAFSAANLEAFKEINKLAADADGALTEGKFSTAQEIVKHLRALTAGQIEASRIPDNVPVGGLHANSGLAGGRVDPASDGLHDYRAGRINPVDQY